MELDASTSSQHKRKRSSSITNGVPISVPTAKVVKPAANSLSINYLARSSSEDLPLIHKEETLPNLLHLLSLYSSVLDRHESLASNLGARPLGPILIKRFERCFDAPPKVVAAHLKSVTTQHDENHHITWLEVIEFARSHPAQFTLSTFSEGRKVCQFYLPQRQLRVQISEEDFLFIKSGRCQELIPPLPIWEDEEKEVSTCDVLESRLKELTNAADMVAARTRQLTHRLKGRRAAILERRAEGGSSTPARVSAPSGAAVHPSAQYSHVRPNESHQSSIEHVTSHSVRNELLRHFETLPQNQQLSRSQSIPAGDADIAHGFRSYESYASQSSLNNAMTNYPPASISPKTTSLTQPEQGHDGSSAMTQHRKSLSIPAVNTVKHNFSKPLAPGLESTQPFRPLCQVHMDSLPKGQRVLPPCDRCRRLRMDCVKNLTSCAGCTKKHARCHWRHVSRDELGALDHLMDSAYSATSPALSESRSNDHRSYGGDEEDSEGEGGDDDSNPFEDLRTLGEHEEQHAGLAARQHNDLVTPGFGPPAVDARHHDAHGPDLAPVGGTNPSKRIALPDAREADARHASEHNPTRASIADSDQARSTGSSQQHQQQHDSTLLHRNSVSKQQLAGAHGSVLDYTSGSSDQGGMPNAGGFRAVNTAYTSATVEP